MPEYWECWAHYFYMSMFLETHKETTNLGVLALWTDATGKEAHLAPDKHVFQLDGTIDLQRGTRGQQTSLFPISFVKTEANPDLPPLQSLTWQDVATTSRAGILNFGKLALKVYFVYFVHFIILTYFLVILSYAYFSANIYSFAVGE